MSLIISKNEQLFSNNKSLVRSGIKFVGIINNKGRIVESFGEVPITMPKDKKEMFFMKIALRNSMQKDFDEYLGLVNYCITQRGENKFISIPISEETTILVITKKDIDVEKIVLQAKQLLTYSSQNLTKKISKEV